MRGAATGRDWQGDGEPSGHQKARLLSCGKFDGLIWCVRNRVTTKRFFSRVGWYDALTDATKDKPR